MSVVNTAKFPTASRTMPGGGWRNSISRSICFLRSSSWGIWSLIIPKWITPRMDPLMYWFFTLVGILASTASSCVCVSGRFPLL